MQLGSFSLSLGVRDLNASRAFYEALGFTVFADRSAHNYMILKNDSVVIGLYQGMFDGAMLTFNPGWDSRAQPVDPFTDVREIKAQARAAGLQVEQEHGGETGPSSFVVVDPDGFPVLIDQHR